jgi:hypothetical protein
MNIFITLGRNGLLTEREKVNNRDRFSSGAMLIINYLAKGFFSSRI